MIIYNVRMMSSGNKIYYDDYVKMEKFLSDNDEIIYGVYRFDVINTVNFLEESIYYILGNRMNMPIKGSDFNHWRCIWDYIYGRGN